MILGKKMTGQKDSIEMFLALVKRNKMDKFIRYKVKIQLLES